MRPPLRLRLCLTVFSLLLFAVPGVQAADYLAPATPQTWHPTSFWQAVGASVVFGFTGIILAVIGFKLFDLVTPFNLEREMCDHKNVAVGILCGAIVLGICHIIAASMS